MGNKKINTWYRIGEDEDPVRLCLKEEPDDMCISDLKDMIIEKEKLNFGASGLQLHVKAHGEDQYRRLSEDLLNEYGGYSKLIQGCEITKYFPIKVTRIEGW